MLARKPPLQVLPCFLRVLGLGLASVPRVYPSKAVADPVQRARDGEGGGTPVAKQKRIVKLGHSDGEVAVIAVHDKRTLTRDSTGHGEGRGHGSGGWGLSARIACIPVAFYTTHRIDTI